MDLNRQIIRLLPKHKITLFLLCGIILCTQESFSEPPTKSLTLTENCQSYIEITGESNVNKFNFIYNPEEVSIANSDYYFPDTGGIEITVPINEFQASNPLMLPDFLELMKASAHPHIKIRFNPMLTKDNNNRSQFTIPTIEITIAGISRSYPLLCNVLNCSDQIYINGSKKMRLSDFNLKPPVKLHGLVKVRNEIDVNFGFIITFTDHNQPFTSL